MKSKFLLIRMYVLLSILFFTALMFYGVLVPITNWQQIIFLLLILFMMPIIFIIGFIKALAISLFLLIVIGAIMTYELAFNEKTINVDQILLVLALPVGTFFVGNIERILNESLSECQNCSLIAEKMILIDEVTGFGNGKNFLEDLQVEIAKAERYSQPLTVGVLEIQYYNDLIRLYEEDVNQVFESLAKAINSVIRIEDMKYRIEKNQIGIIMPFTDIKKSYVVKERLKERFNEIEIKSPSESKQKFVLTIKFGLLEYHKGISSHVEFKKLAENELEYDV